MQNGQLIQVMLMLVGLGLGGPLLMRLLAGPPNEDEAVIEDYLKAQGETRVSVRNSVNGAPPTHKDPVTQRIIQLPARPYRVVGRTPDGAVRAHEVAVIGLDFDGRAILQERVGGVWRGVRL